MEKTKELGDKRAIELKTSGPFHTKMLKEASIELKKELENISINSFESKVIKNIDGKEYLENDDIKSILSAHIINPVKFEQSLKTMIDMGIDTFIEIGPGKTLSGFVKKVNKDFNVYNINNVDSLKNTLNQISVGGKNE